MRADQSIARVIAFVRRLLQMTFANEANFTCATLLVINELFRSRSDVRYAIFQHSKSTTATQLTRGDSDEEVFQDIDRIEDEVKQAENAVNKTITNKMKTEPYDPLKREPKYAQAVGEPMWELITLARHCHPTIALWA